MFAGVARTRLELLTWVVAILEKILEMKNLRTKLTRCGDRFYGVHEEEEEDPIGSLASVT